MINLGEALIDEPLLASKEISWIGLFCSPLKQNLTLLEQLGLTMSSLLRSDESSILLLKSKRFWVFWASSWN